MYQFSPVPSVALSVLACIISGSAFAGDVTVNLPGLGIAVSGISTGAPSATAAPTASCTAAVPATAHVAKGEIMYNDAGGTFLVCPGAKATFNGAGSTVYAMGPAQIFVNGAGVNVTSAGASQIMVTGANNHVVSDNVGMISTVGVNDSVAQCPSVVIDTKALKQGC